MKVVFTLVLVVFLAVGIVGCSGSPKAESESSSVESNPDLRTVALEVPTIWCVTCQPRVEASAKSVTGVEEVRFDNQTVIVTYDSTETSPEAIVEAIESGGDTVAKVTRL